MIYGGGYGKNTYGGTTGSGINYFSALTETITFTDVLIKKAVRILSETVTHTDTLVRTALKKLSETVTSSDTLNRTTSRILSEATTLTDSIKKTTGKILLETISILDLTISFVVKVKDRIGTIVLSSIRRNKNML